MFTLTPDRLVRMAPDSAVGAFDCGDADLNEFLLKDAKSYLAELMAVTYLVMDNARVAGFLSRARDRPLQQQ